MSFEVIFNNSYIRLIILNGIVRVLDLLSLMFTSATNRKIITKSLEHVTVEIGDCCGILHRFGYPPIDKIIKNLSSLHRLIIHSPPYESLLHLKRVDKLELFEFTCGNLSTVQQKNLMKHLNEVVKDELIITFRYRGDRSFQRSNLCYQLIRKLDLHRLPIQYLELDMNHITSINTHYYGPGETFPPYKNHIPKFLLQKQFPMLHTVSLAGHTITDEILKNLSESSAVGLIQVSLVDCENVTDVGLSYFIKSVTNLTVIDLPLITDLTLQLADKVEILHICHCMLVKGSFFKNLHIKQLNLGTSQEYLKLSYAITLFGKIPKLEMTTQIIENFWDLDNPYSHYSLITDLHLPDSFFLTDEVMGNFNRIKKLTFGVENAGTRYTDNGIKNLIQNRDSNAGDLEFWVLSSSEITDRSLMYLSKVSIKTLHISNNRNITDKGIKHLRGIEEIEISNCPCLTDESLKVLCNVKKIKIENCPLITEKGYSYLTNLVEITINDSFPVVAIKHLKSIDTLVIAQWKKNSIPDDLAGELVGIKEIVDINLNNGSFLSKEAQCYLSKRGVIIDIMQ
ncbi:hypothetical protein DLAC_06821 [Tieghemostelium lacteum]|uniref:Uncharacterized protein n=1 Tax=Tieghemostelium lacteum TaxID=361077 RepID=A0A151ZDF8_TIELA|nr:hypothetical protein DLAC_06821 [Tieghemostelium lacteum]|eukprot:KYQ91998.1 hypothetical protein DLAC_06821 [Tieghemostelium lacteum]